jgi:hypothetical protein
MLNTPFSPWPSFSEEEANAVRDVILSNKVNYWTGQECREFEKELQHGPVASMPSPWLMALLPWIWLCRLWV